MNEKKAEERTQKSFAPDPKLIKYVQERLQLTRKMEQLDAAEEKFPIEINSKDRSLRTQKTRILDEIIFPAMANLIYFFKVVAENPELQALFESDIKDLLGVRRKEPMQQMYGFVLFGLLSDILKIGGSQYKGSTEYNEDDFRLRLNHALQQIVFHKMSMSLSQIFKTDIAQKIVADDFNRVRAWTGMLAYGVDRKEAKEVPHRTFDLNINELSGS